jgi:hypothetical protein
MEEKCISAAYKWDILIMPVMYACVHVLDIKVDICESVTEGSPHTKCDEPCMCQGGEET